MSGYLLDTNVISELTRDIPSPQILGFLAGREDIWVSSILIHEIEYGLRILPQGRRRNRLSIMQANILASYAERILPLNREGAEWAAEFRADARRNGRSIDLGDALMAGIARAYELTMVTRNVKDFGGMDLDILNPWDAE